MGIDFLRLPGCLTITTEQNATILAKNRTPPQNCSAAGFAYVLKQPKTLISSGFRA